MERCEKNQLPIWTMDIETDPFLRDRVPVPFCIGLYDGVTFHKWWSDRNGTCIQKAKMFLEDVPLEDRGIVYMHNGGRFDFFYLLDWFEGRSMIMNGRIVKTYMPVGKGKSKDRQTADKSERFEFRDSFAIMPFALRQYQKDEIDINLLSRENRHQHKAEIESYLFGDCRYLWELCMAFQREFGDYTTIASAAFNQLSAMHSFESMPKRLDSELRSLYYFGGRVECRAKGVLKQPCKIYDVNSMYPAVMQQFYHPTSWPSLVGNQILWKEKPKAGKDLLTFFLTVEGLSFGAFPRRQPDGSVEFPTEHGVFHCTIHEYQVAVKLGLFRCDKVLKTYSFLDYSKFDQFVSHFFKLRNKAKADGDKMHTLFYKFILNSAYGKFGLNPENYSDWLITRSVDSPGEGWQLDSMAQGQYWIWKKPNNDIFGRNLKNIATAASITGAARSVLLSAIAQSKGVIYCDTDSIICEEFCGGSLDDYKLGSWKQEGTGDRAAIAGKKLYAIFAGKECIKQASKGVVITPEEIEAICRGEDVISFRDAPTFQRDGQATFVSRKVRMT